MLMKQSGTFVTRDATYLACSSRFPPTTSVECLQPIREIEQTKQRTQRWMEFLSTSNISMSYRRGKDNDNTDFLSRLLLPPAEKDVSGSCSLSDLDNLGVYLICAHGLVPTSFIIPCISLGGLAPLSPSTRGPGMGGLTLTHDHLAYTVPHSLNHIWMVPLTVTNWCLLRLNALYI